MKRDRKQKSAPVRVVREQCRVESQKPSIESRTDLCTRLIDIFHRFPNCKPIFLRIDPNFFIAIIILLRIMSAQNTKEFCRSSNRYSEMTPMAVVTPTSVVK